MSSRRIRHILVAIGDLRPPKYELRKAAAIARAFGARVELFHAIDEADPARSYPETLTRTLVDQQRAAIVARSQKRLARFARDESLAGIKVTCTITWDHPAYSAISRRALAAGTDLVIAATRGHRFGARLVLRNTDWELIRHCPVPLLLVKSRRPWRQPTVLAAVDPLHAHAKPANLDARLLTAAGQFANALKGRAHVFHAYMPLFSVEPAPFSAVVAAA